MKLSVFRSCRRTCKNDYGFRYLHICKLNITLEIQPWFVFKMKSQGTLAGR